MARLVARIMCSWAAQSPVRARSGTRSRMATAASLSPAELSGHGLGDGPEPGQVGTGALGDLPGAGDEGQEQGEVVGAAGQRAQLHQDPGLALPVAERLERRPGHLELLDAAWPPGRSGC